MSRYLSRASSLVVPAILLSFLLGAPAFAAEGCTIVNGHGRTLFDPSIGAFVGPIDLDGDGVLDATSSAFVLSMVPTDDGTLHAVTSHVIVTGGVTITTLDRAVLSPTDTPGLYRLNTHLVVTDGGSGTLTLHGYVHLIEGWAEADIHGRICG
jgi:hypothetical protein